MFNFLDVSLILYFLQVYPYQREKAHINIGNPDKRKSGDKKSSPISKKQFETSYKKHENSNVVTETVFAGE
jgi:hypothetical protein